MRSRLVSALCAIVFTLSALAQGTTSRAIGTIQDSTGSPLAGIKVTLTNEGTNQSFFTQTADNGTYVFDAVQSGLYTVKVEAPGFKVWTSKNNQLAIGQPMTVNATLEVGSVSESIEVTASYEQVQLSTSGNNGNLFTDRIIRDLPIVGTRGRNPLDLVARQPGVVSGANTGGGTHVNGARDRAWNFTVDGIDANETSAGGSNFAPIRTNPDSLAEFRVMTGNGTAEYGRNSGGQVAMVTRSGTNDLHGSGFWFYRTPRFNANEWEFNLNRLVKRQFVQHIYGGSIGGPIQRNRTFFFYNNQRLAARESAILDRTVYTATARQGLWRYNRGGRNLPSGVAGATVDASGNVAPGVSVGQYNIFASDPNGIGANRQILGVINNTPLPNNFTGGDGLNTGLFTFAALQFERQMDQTAKIDHIVNDKNTVFGRISWGNQNTNCDRGNGGAPFFPGQDCIVNTLRNPRNMAFNWRTNPSAKWTNELVVGRNFFAFDFVIPQAKLDGISLTGAPITYPETFYFGNKRELNTWQVVNNTSYFAGAHTFRMGINFRLASHTDVRGSIGGSNSTTQVDFSRLVNTVGPAFNLPADVNQQFDRNPLESSINFLLGRVGSVSRGFISDGSKFIPGVYNFKANFNEYDAFFQDTWRLRKNLTIDLGLRYEAKMAPTSHPSDRIRRPNQAAVAGYGGVTNLRWESGSLYRNDLNNFAPSIGFAWDPFGTGKTSVRGNYRLAFDRINTFLLSSSIFQNLPGIVQGRTIQPGLDGTRLTGVQALAPPATDPSAFATPPAFSLNNITVADPNFETPQTHQFSFGIQREIAKQTVLEVNYIGRRGHNLFGAYNANQVNTTGNGFLEAVRAAAPATGSSALIEQIMAPDTRRAAGEAGVAAFRRLYAVELRNNALGTIANDLGRRTVAGGRTQVEAAGLNPAFFFPFPQFAGGLFTIDSNDFSTYHALQMQIERRLYNGFTVQLSWTVAKSLDTRSFDPAFTVAGSGAGQSASSTPFNINNRRYNYAPSDFDRTHAIQSYWLYELPFGKGKKYVNGVNGWMDRVVGSWQLAGFLTIQGGRPFTIYSGNNTYAQTVNSTADCSTCARDIGAVREEGGLKWYLSPEERAQFALTTALGSVGTTGRNLFRGPGSFNMDMSLSKRVKITEGKNIEIRADMTNFTNTPTFGFPTATVTSATFGRIRDSVLSGSRKIQLGAKFNF